MFHSPSNFTVPEKFHPERWLGDPLFSNDDKPAFQPFSSGPRNCIGKRYVLLSRKQQPNLIKTSLAYAEMRLVLAKMLWNFDLELMSESENWFPHEMVVIWNSPDLHIKLHPVQR
jgi:cytochrome P450